MLGSRPDLSASIGYIRKYQDKNGIELWITGFMLLWSIIIGLITHNTLITLTFQSLHVSEFNKHNTCKKFSKDICRLIFCADMFQYNCTIVPFPLMKWCCISICFVSLWSGFFALKLFSYLLDQFNRFYHTASVEVVLNYHVFCFSGWES